ncbi:MAG: class I SAM-dependent methyltransferase [Planctomycetota bacterium]
MQQDYAQHYRTLYEQHWWWRCRENLLLRELHQFAGDRREMKLLDVGCGDGLFFPKLRQFGQVWGVETDASIVAQDNPDRDSIHVGFMDEDCPHRGPFSVILMLDVLEHIDQPEEPLRYAASLLEPDGILLITVPAFQSLWTRHDEINHHYRRYTKASMRALADRSGVLIDRAEYFYHWLVPAKMLVRAKEAMIAGEPAPAGLPPPWINQTLQIISNWERRLAGWMNLPVGSSLLTVARRA